MIMRMFCDVLITHCGVSASTAESGRREAACPQPPHLPCGQVANNPNIEGFIVREERYKGIQDQDMEN